MKLTLVLLVVNVACLASVLGKKPRAPRERNSDTEDSPTFNFGTENIYGRPEGDEPTLEHVKNSAPEKRQRVGLGSRWESNAEEPSPARVFPEDDVRLSKKDRGDRSANRAPPPERPVPEPSTKYASDKRNPVVQLNSLSSVSGRSPTDRLHLEDVKPTKKPHGKEPTPAPWKGTTEKLSTDSPTLRSETSTEKPQVDGGGPTTERSTIAETPAQEWGTSTSAPFTTTLHGNSVTAASDERVTLGLDQSIATRKPAVDHPATEFRQAASTDLPHGGSPAPEKSDTRDTTHETPVDPGQNNIPHQDPAVGKNNVGGKSHADDSHLTAGPDRGNSSGVENRHQENAEDTHPEKTHYDSPTTDPANSNSTTNPQSDHANPGKEHITKTDSNQQSTKMALQPNNLKLTTLPPTHSKVTTKLQTLPPNNLKYTTKPPPKTLSTKKMYVTTKSPKALPHKKVHVTTKPPPKTPTPKTTLPPKHLKLTTQPPRKAHH